MMIKPLIELWFFSFFFSRACQTIIDSTQKTMSLKELLELYASFHPDYIIRALARRKIKSQTQQIHYYIELPWSCYQLWPELLKIFQKSSISTLLPGWGKIIFLNLWLGALEQFISFKNCTSLSFLSLIFSTFLILRVFFLQQKEAFELAYFYYGTHQEKCQYYWYKNKAYPQTLPIRWRDSYERFAALSDHQEKKTLELLYSYAQMRYELCQSSRQRFTYSMIYITFFSCLMVTGQEFMEHLYCAHQL